MYLALMCGRWESSEPQDKILKLKTLEYSYLHRPIWTLQPIDSTLTLVRPNENRYWHMVLMSHCIRGI